MQHSLIVSDQHIAHSWTYVNSTARLAATGFTSNDLGKMCLQNDTKLMYILTAITPTWDLIETDSGNIKNYNALKMYQISNFK